MKKAARAIRAMGARTVVSESPEAVVALKKLAPLVGVTHELEVLHLCDGLGLTQAEAGEQMGVSRGTVQRILADARQKVATALVEQHAVAIRHISS